MGSLPGLQVGLEDGGEGEHLDDSGDQLADGEVAAGLVAVAELVEDLAAQLLRACDLSPAGPASASPAVDGSTGSMRPREAWRRG